MNDNMQFSLEDFGISFPAENAAATTPVNTVTATVAAPSAVAKTSVAIAKAKPATAETTKKEKKETVKVDGLKAFYYGDRTVNIPAGTFSKKTVPVTEACEAFVSLASLSVPAKAFTAKSNAGGILVGYTKDVISKGDVLPNSVIGYRIFTPDGTKDILGEVTDALIREALAADPALAKYADEAFGYVVDGDVLIAVPVPTEFKVPYTDKITVVWDGKDVSVPITKKDDVKSAKKPESTEDDEAEDDEDEDDGAADDGEQVSSYDICTAFGKLVKKVGCFELAKMADGTILAVPSVTSPTVAKPEPAVAERDKKRPITPDLKIYWISGELSLYNLEPEGEDKPGTVGMTEISEAEALKILQARFPYYRTISHMHWFEDEHYWFPDYPSSTKGGVTPLFSVTEDNLATWLVPKIPGKLLAHVVTAFAYTEATSGNEQAAAFLFDTRTKTWRVSIPTQTATPASVTCNYAEDAEIPYEVVGVQMHSHPNMRISFSSVDDRDELSEGTLYCVMRCTEKKGGHTIDCRIRHNGQFLMVPLDWAFELP